MKDFFKTIWKDYLVSAILTVLIGVLLTVFSSVAIDVVCIGIGVAAVVIGVIAGVRYLRRPENRYELLMGLIFVALGIYVICNPKALEKMVAVVFGIVILFHGIVDAQSTVELYKARDALWPVALIISLLTIAAGCVLIFLSSLVVEMLAVVIGIMLMCEGLMDIWVAVKVRKLHE